MVDSELRRRPTNESAGSQTGNALQILSSYEILGKFITELPSFHYGQA
jgi:hypothetical protein